MEFKYGLFNTNIIKKIFLITICMTIILTSISTTVVFASNQENLHKNTNLDKTRENNYIFLSDLDYIIENNWSYNGWSGHTIQKDKNQDGGVLGLIVDGEKITYSKGISVHAKGQVTYDISAISTQYSRFIAKIGVDSSRGTNGSIWFQIYVSNDGVTWTSLLKTNTLTGISNCIDVDLNVQGYKYLRIYVDPDGANAADHGTIANARFVTKDFVNSEIFYDKIHKLEYYDEILKQHDVEYNYEHNYRLILEREFVRKVGFWTIQNLVEYTPDSAETLDWILSDNQNLEQIIEVGEIASGSTFINTIHKIYSKYKDEFKTENGYVYQKMMIGLSGAYGTDRVASPLTFSTRVGTYDVLERFTLMKKIFDDGLFMRTDEFKTYNVQLMRYVMQDSYRPEETLWLNALSKTKSNPLNHYAYLSYRLGPSYGRPEYQDLANKEKYDSKYMLTQYNVPYGDGITRYWMAMEYGGICWNISRTGQSVYRVNGIPSVGIYQPQHEAYLGYSQDENGIGVWGAYYNVFGWGKSCTTWYGGNPYRMLFNWGAKYFTDKAVTATAAGNSAGYMILGQACLNQKEPFFKSLYLNLLANSYDDNDEKINVYNKALESSKLNLDSYDSIITLYKGMNKTSSQWHDLAERVIDSYTYYPMAMYDLLKVIKPYLQGADRVDIDLREHDALVLSSKSTDNDVLQSSALRQIASVLLGKTSVRLATFSFDGENSGNIVIDPSYDNYDFNLYYSLDGGTTFSEKTTSHKIQLTFSEIERINDENDIRIYMDGTPQVYVIDIIKGTLPSNLYANDLENRVMGVGLTYEWRQSDNDSWTSYKDASPDNTGNKTLEVRIGYTGNSIPSDSVKFTFTDDNQPDTRKYIPISRLSVSDASMQEANYPAKYCIDGNYYTYWLNSTAGNNDDERFIVIKLDRTVYLSAMDYVPHPANGKILKGKILGSIDGESFTEIADVTWQNNEQVKTIDFTPVEVRYVKIVGTEVSYTNSSKVQHMGARMFNFYEDKTKIPNPSAGIAYSTTDPTSGNVIARLINKSSEDVTIVNNGGSDTYEFTNNGEFTFELRDSNGLIGYAKAKVDWIDRVVPTATIEYSTTFPTNKSVIATLKPSEDVVVINNSNFIVNDDGEVVDKDGNILDGYTVDNDGNVKDSNGNIIANINQFTYEFIDNGKFTFEFIDKAGNKGTATAEVTWIDTEVPEATLIYSKNELTNKDVSVRIEFNEEVVITNNNGSREYTFKENGEFKFTYKDAAGNIGEKVARVNWIDKIIPKAELKYENQNNKVIVKIINPSEEIIFKEGIGVYEFTKNGKYEIVFYDKAGNEGKLVAIIDSFKENIEKPEDKKPNTPNDTFTSNTQDKTDKVNNDEPIENTPINIEYKKYTTESINVDMPIGSMKEDATLISKTFEVSEKLKNNFGKFSEYYDIYFENANFERLDASSNNSIKISFKTNKERNFIGVYQILDNDVVKPIVDYIKNGENIEIIVNNLGKYVISYDELKTEDSQFTQSSNEQEKNNNNFMLLFISGTVIALGGILYFIIKLKK